MKHVLSLSSSYGELVALATVAFAWFSMALGVGTAVLCWDRKEKIGAWFSRGMLSLACMLIAYALGVAILTAGRWLIVSSSH